MEFTAREGEFQDGKMAVTLNVFASGSNRNSQELKIDVTV